MAIVASCPKYVARREMAGMQSLIEQVSLGSFADARRTQQYQPIRLIGLRNRPTNS